jgi:hypothetical protein
VSGPRLVCGVSDGRGKTCGRQVEGPRPFAPYEGPREPRFLIGDCPKHGHVAITQSRFDRAVAAGQATVHLARGRGTPRGDFMEDEFVMGMFENLARRWIKPLES